MQDLAAIAAASVAHGEPYSRSVTKPTAQTTATARKPVPISASALERRISVAFRCPPKRRGESWSVR